MSVTNDVVHEVHLVDWGSKGCPTQAWADEVEQRGQLWEGEDGCYVRALRVFQGKLLAHEPLLGAEEFLVIPSEFTGVLVLVFDQHRYTTGAEADEDWPKYQEKAWGQLNIGVDRWYRRYHERGGTL